MSWPVTINSTTYQESDFDGYSYVTNFPAIIADIAAEAATVQNNADIAQSAGGLNYQFNTATSAADPGSGKLAFNSGTLASATALYISETTDAAQDASGFLAYWDDSTSATKGLVRITQQADVTVFAIFEITGAVTDNGGWDTFTVAHVAGNGSFSNNDEITVTFTPAGDKGDPGSGVADGDYGDVTVSGSGAAYTVNTGAITAAKLAASAVETAKINNAAVTREKIATAAYQVDYVSLSADQTFASADANVLQILTGSTPRTWTVPTNASVAFALGVEIPVFNNATADLTLTASSGVTVNGVSAGSVVLAARQSGMLKKVGTNEWIYMGAGQESWA